MRLLQINKAYSPHIGGVEAIVAQLAEGLGHHAVFSRVLACADGRAAASEVLNRVSVERAATLARPLGMPVSADFFRRFRVMAREADSIMLHHPFPLGFAASEMIAPEKPTYVWYHSDIVRQRISAAVLLPLLRRVLARARAIFVSGRRLVENSRLLQPFRDKCAVIPFGIDCRQFEPTLTVANEAESIRRRFGTPLVLSVGRLVYYKGFEYLVEAMRGVKAHLVIVGSGRLETRLRMLAANCGVAAQLHLVRSVTDLLPYYHACDLFVLPSVASSEAFGLVQLEAMACGKPVINTALPTAVPEVSIHNETGLTVPPRDSLALAGAINLLLANPALRAHFGRNARTRVATDLSLDRFIATVAAHLGSPDNLARPAASG